MHQNAQEMPAYLRVFVGGCLDKLNSRGQLVACFGILMTGVTVCYLRSMTRAQPTGEDYLAR